MDRHGSPLKSNHSLMVHLDMRDSKSSLNHRGRRRLTHIPITSHSKSTRGPFVVVCKPVWVEHLSHLTGLTSDLASCQWELNVSSNFRRFLCTLNDCIMDGSMWRIKYRIFIVSPTCSSVDSVWGCTLQHCHLCISSSGPSHPRLVLSSPWWGAGSYLIG